MSEIQLGFEGMPRRLLQAAPSRLGCYLDCPRRYRFSYLDRPPPPKGPPWAHNSFGAAIHTALANWWKAPRERRTVDQIALLLDQAWLIDGYRDDAQREEARQRAHEMLERYVAKLDPDDEPIGVERTVAFKTDHAALFGRVDRIDERPGEGLVIVDYKTGRQVLTLDDARSSLALAIYALGAERTLRRRCRRVELHHLPTGDVLAWDHTDEGLARHRRRADSIAREISGLDERFRSGVSDEEADRLYPPSVGPMCGWCDFNRACPEGRAAAAPRDSWAGVEQPVR
ncbi:MAG: PD-(D/E)XK nuclease family protein [Actinomycetota bacterium]|nr:PD-(D/E)XK nuclease family protein [Actinomycetota bacterium]